MAVVGSLIVLLGGNNTQLTKTLAQSEAQLKSFGATNAGVAGSFSPIGAAAGIAGLAVVAGVGMAIRAAADFEAQMNTINTIARLDPGPLAAVGKEIRALSVETGAGLPDLTSSFYDLLSVGVPLANAMDVLGNSVTLSEGGLGTVGQAATAITGAINAWNASMGAAKLTMGDSAKVMDIYAKAIELGDIKTKDLPAAMANVASTAANFNVPIQEVAASLALMSTKFIAPTEGATAMNAAFTALQRVPPGMEKLQKATGKTYEQIARTEGMHSALMQLVADAQTFSVNLVDVFGRTDALPFVFSTTGAAAAQFGSFMGQIYEPYGTAASQAGERTKGLDHQLDILGATVNDLGINLGTALLPGLTNLISQINDGLTKIEGVIQHAVDLYNKLPSWMREDFKPENAVPNLVNPTAPSRGVQPGLTDYVGQQLGWVGKFAPPTPLWGTFNTPGFHAGENGSPFAGPPTPGFGQAAFGDDLIGRRASGQPIQINHTTTVVLDGQKVGEVVERQMYDNASGWSSGFSTDERPRH